MNIKYPQKSLPSRQFLRKVYNYQKADWDSFRLFIRDVPWSEIFRVGSSDVVLKLSEWVKCGINSFVPCHKYHLYPNSQPWFTPACATAIAHRNHFFHLKQRDNCLENHKLFRHARNRCCKVLRDAKDYYSNSIRSSIESTVLGSRQFWHITNKILNRGKSQIPPIFNGPEVLTSSKDKADLFCDCFSQNSTLDDANHPLPNFPSRCDIKVMSVLVTPKRVSNTISCLDASKANGPDGISAIVLQKCSPELSPILSKLFNKCLAEGVFPDCWKVASVVPTYKNKGERSDCSSY